ncbi:hypothetical protein B296_00035866 [Ensete ventricosum]|uniref:NTF2 domain-containing protein n=1 Tax=Ensete ventricosum TaxID=4639 RepID=A0A427A1K6_ENSVE|nr:hypothetical protein B296_00035866 [Ensete ventricosum]
MEQAINDMIMSLDFRNCFTEIETADSQISYQNGVVIVVTGSFIGQDALRRKFAQSFFLAPQEKGGYFVLNDVFRFLSGTQPREMDYMLGDGAKDVPPQVPISPEAGTKIFYELGTFSWDKLTFLCPFAEPTCQEHDATETPLLEENADNMDELLNQSEDGGSDFEDEVDVDPRANTGESDSQTVHEVIASGGQDDLPKKSYASILMLNESLRNDNFRGRSSFNSNMGYRRNEFRSRAEYSGRGWGPGFRGNDGYQQRAFQNGDGTIVGGDPRGGEPKITAVSA